MDGDQEIPTHLLEGLSPGSTPAALGMVSLCSNELSLKEESWRQGWCRSCTVQFEAWWKLWAEELAEPQQQCLAISLVLAW